MHITQRERQTDREAERKRERDRERDKQIETGIERQKENKVRARDRHAIPLSYLFSFLERKRKRFGVIKRESE